MPIIDFHCDTIDKIYHTQGDLRHNSHHIDLSKLKAAQYAAQWFAVFVDAKEVKGSLMEKAVEMIAYFKRQLSLYKDDVLLATDYTNYKAIREQQKIAAFLSLEEGQIIEGSLENIQKLYAEGVRLMTLTWNYENDLGYPHWSQKGLTTFGKEAVEYLNALPILLDVSHLSEAALKDIEGLYKKPIIASHCNARHIYNHTRNLTDEAIRCIAKSGGIIGLNFYSVFLDGSSHGTIEAMVKHIDHLYRIGGEACLGIGTDFDGINCTLEVCNAGEMGRLIERLGQSYSEDFIDKLTYKNAERILKENL